MSTEENVNVSRDRLARVIEVLSVVSLGQYDPALTTISTGGQEDEFAQIEETLNVLTRELEEAKRENSAYVDQAERARKELEDKLMMIERQQMAIRDLSTPIIELWDDVLTLPVVGIVDTQRSVEMTEKLLRRVVDTRARCVIIDITGVDVVDTMTADHFIKMIKAAQLLGAYCLITGISPDIAQTLVRIGVELAGVRTLRNLKEALQDCFLYLRSIDEEEDELQAQTEDRA